MNSKQRKTLVAVFAEPVSVTIAWTNVEALLVAIGCEILEGSGSRVRFKKDDEVLYIHRPHPAKEIKPYQVREVRGFLADLGIGP